MKKTVLVICVAMALSACNLKSKPNITTTSIPTQAKLLATQANAASHKMKSSKENTIVYFNPNGEVQTTPQVGGFYRKLLGKNRAGQAIVQDFYQDSNTKQTNPMILLDMKNFDNFDSAVMQGRVIWYNPAGEITQFLDYQNGLVQRGGYYNQAGTLVLETEGDNHLNPNAPVKIRGYYDNGQILFENNQANDKSESVFYYDNGQKMWHGMSSTETIHAWNRDGQPVELSEIADDIAAAEKRASQLTNQYMSNN